MREVLLHLVDRAASGGDSPSEGAPRLMDTSEARRLTDEHLPWLIWALQLQKWNVTVSMEHIGESRMGGRNFVAECKADPSTHLVTIRLDPEQIDSEAELLKSLRHELFHVFHAEDDHVRRVLGQHMSQDAFDSIDVLLSVLAESIVRRLESFLDKGLRMSPAAMIARVRRSGANRRAVWDQLHKPKRVKKSSVKVARKQK